MIDLAALFSALASAAQRHPYLAALVAVLWLASNAWKAVPRASRAALEQRYPRPVGVLRVFLQLTADVFGAARTLFYQVVLGRAREPIAPEPEPDAAPDADAPTGHKLDTSTLPSVDDSAAAVGGPRPPDTPAQDV